MRPVKALYALLTDALSLLPVHPCTERTELGLARYQAALTGWGELRGLPVSLEDLKEVFIGEVPGSPRVSPRGAKLLLDLLHRGAFELVPERKQPNNIELLEAYAGGKASILEVTYRRSGKRRPDKPEKQRNSVGSPLQPMAQKPVEHGALYQTRYPITTHRII